MKVSLYSILGASLFSVISIRNDIGTYFTPTLSINYFLKFKIGRKWLKGSLGLGL